MVLLETGFMTFIDIILHIDVYLKTVIETYHLWTYVILFAVIFCETGFVFTPFLPGDSLLFAAGAFAALGSLNIYSVFFIILMAASIGDLVNYTAGKYIGPKIFRKEDSLLFNKKYLVQTEKFYEKHGSKTIIAARFIPIIRTFAPFIAGIGKMKALRFMFYNITGALLWCSFFILGGYFFGNISFVKEHFSWVILGIVVFSFFPVIKGVLKGVLQSRLRNRQNKNQ